MKISVVIPNFNTGEYLRKAIDSVLSQNWIDKEVIVMDGGSNDTSLEILKSYGDKIIWFSEKDKGQYDAINKGLKVAKGEIFSYLNADDWYEKDIFEYVERKFSDIENLTLLYGDCRRVTLDNQSVVCKPPKDVSVKKLLNYGNLIYQPSTFFRRKSLVDTGGVREYNYMMEYDMYLNVLKNGVCLYSNKIFSNFLLRPGQKSEDDKGIMKEVYSISKKHGAKFLSPLGIGVLMSNFVSSETLQKIKKFLLGLKNYEGSNNEESV